MGTEINLVKTQVQSIVNSLAGTDNEPDEYLLVRFGDPDVGAAITTSDSSTYLSYVNSLSPGGGGDCPELSQSALMRAVSASRNDSNIYLFTDASAKDSSLANSVVAAAQAKRIRITPVLTGSCSPIDPAYYKNAEETGGQLFYINPNDTDSLFDLIRPQLSGDFVTIMRSKGTFGSANEEFNIPVDSTISRIVFSCNMDTKGEVIVTRPSGDIIQPDDHDVTISELPRGVIVSVNNPEHGEWNFSIDGEGEFSATAQANSSLNLHIFEFVEFSELASGYQPITGQPIVNTPQIGLVNMIGQYSEANFSLIDQYGSIIENLDFSQGAPNTAEVEFLGDITLPNIPFRIAVSGLDQNGVQFARLFPTLFRTQTVSIQHEVTSETGYIRIGNEKTIQFTVTNHGDAEIFQIVSSDDLNLTEDVTPATLSLDSGETSTVEVNLYAPEATEINLEDRVTVTATSTSDNSITNSSTVYLVTLPSNSSPDCSGAENIDISLHHPNLSFETINIQEEAEVIDPDGDTLTFSINSITQDEPVSGFGAGFTSPDARGLGTGIAEIRKESMFWGNGRVYNINFTASDGNGGACSATLAVTVPNFMSFQPAIDDGQDYDSTTGN